MKKGIQGIVYLGAVLLALSIQAQEPLAQLHGKILDQNGGVIPGARLRAVCRQGIVKTSVAGDDGSYTMELPVGKQCVIHITAHYFVEATRVESLSGSVADEDFTLNVQASSAEVVVHADSGPLISVDPAANSGAIILGQHELDTLPDDPEDLMEDLLAMAGPTPSGGVQIYTDGFTAQQLPPKSSIRKIKINEDPFSAQYHHVGLGRIEVLTKPGTNPAHGEFAYRYGNVFFDSLNPYAVKQAPYWSQLITGGIGGPLTSKISYFGNFQDWNEEGNAVIDAQVLDQALNPVSLRQTLLVPAQNLASGLRLDYQASENTTLTGRFEYTRRSADGRGPGGFVLSTSAYNTVEPEENLQLSAVSAFNRATLNQLRFEYLRQNMAQVPSNTTPATIVLDSFTSGGSSEGAFSQNQSLYEIQDYISKAIGKQTLMVGGQARFTHLYNSAPTDFNGEFVFSGGSAPVLNQNYGPVLGSNGQPLTERVSSLERYQRTLLFQSMGMTPTEIRALGGGASQYTVASGAPSAQAMQFDCGAFIQDDWKATKSLSLSAGFRWEGQNTIQRWTDFAPRIGMAWMPFRGHTGTVMRVGGGIFFDRFAPGLYLSALRYNGVLQQRFIVANPDFYPVAPAVSSMANLGLPEAIQTISPSLRSPYSIQSSASVEQRLPGSVVASLTVVNTLGRHLLYSANVGASAAAWDNYQYQSEGSLNETQVTVSIRRKYRHGFALFGNYTLTHARDNTDGPMMFPMNGNNIAAEYGRAATDIHHYAMLDTTMPGLFGAKVISYFVARSGAPFNITTGHDNNGDSIYNDRPGIATDSTKPGLISTPYGLLDPFPSAGETILQRNAGQGPGYIALNLRLSRAFALHHAKGSGVVPPVRTRPAWFQMPRTPSGSYMTFIVTARNVLNHTNRGLPSGNLSSPLFNQSNVLASPTNPLHPSYENNRRIQFEVRFNF